MKPGFYNTGMMVDGVKQLKGFDCAELMQVPYISIGSYVLSYKTIYDVMINPLHPLTFVHPDGTHYRTDRHFQSDRMSNPKCTQWIWERTRFIGPIFHDSSYCFKGLWAAIPQVDSKGNITFLPEFRFLEMTRKKADDLLAVMLKYDPTPASRLSIAAIWLGVRIGGWASWGRGDFRSPPETRNKLDSSKPAILLG